MSSRLILADSSAWVGYLGRQKWTGSAVMGELLRGHHIAVNDVIRMEVLTGALSEAQYTELAETFKGLHVLPLTDTIWRRAERLRFELRQKGHLIPVPDVLIACCALLYDCELFHADQHFDAIARLTPLRIHRPAVLRRHAGRDGVNN